MAVTDETLRRIADSRRALTTVTDEQTRAIVAQWVQAWDELLPEYEASIADLLADAKEGRVSAAKVRANKRLRQALQVTRANLDGLADATNLTITASIPEAINVGGNGAAAVIGTQVPPTGAAIVVGWDTVSPEAIAAMVDRTTQRIHSATLPIPEDVERVMKRELIRGISVGANPRETARRIIKRAEGNFNGGLTRALTIARTETLDASRTAAHAAAQQNADILTGWKWGCDLSTRTCPACLSKHGTLYDNEAYGPDGHQNCRCARIDLTKTWRELGFNIDEPADTFPDAQAWYGNLTPDSQAEIMGRARRDLLNSGAIGWDDLATVKHTDGWRDSWHVTPVKDLLAKAA